MKWNDIPPNSFVDWGYGVLLQAILTPSGRFRCESHLYNFSLERRLTLRIYARPGSAYHLPVGAFKEVGREVERCAYPGHQPPGPTPVGPATFFASGGRARPLDLELGVCVSPRAPGGGAAALVTRVRGVLLSCLQGGGT